MVTCPSPAKTTFPLRRTHRMVVERIFLLMNRCPKYEGSASMADPLNLYFSTAQKKPEPSVVNPKAETREKGHNGVERCISSLSRINRRGKGAVPGSMTRSSAGPHWSG